MNTILTRPTLPQRLVAAARGLYRRSQLTLLDTEILSVMSHLDGLRELRASLPMEIEDAKRQLHSLLDQRRALGG